MSDDAGKGSVLIRTSGWWLAVFAAIILVPWLLLPTGREGASSFSESDRHSVHGSEVSRRIQSHKGPWGDLRIVRIVTEPPEGSLEGYSVYPRPVWSFKNYTAAQFERLIVAAKLSLEQRAEIGRAARWDASGVGCAVMPPDDFVMNLSPESRAVLYNALSAFPENVLQYEPFRFRADLADEWFANSGVPKETVALVRRLSYVRGKTLLFCDPHLVLPGLPSELDRVRLLKTLARQSTLMVQLHITPDTDIASLAAYWGAQENRVKNIKPLLESVARIPGGFDIDVSHLLPRFARKRIYTYPSGEGDKGEAVYDCHWNSMNFWNDPPDDRFADNAYVIKMLKSDYEPVLDNFKLGDVVLFMKSDTDAIHSAVYVADDIVFTKNGASAHSPWILMLMDTLVAHYAINADLKIRGYRKKVVR